MGNQQLKATQELDWWGKKNLVEAKFETLDVDGMGECTQAQYSLIIEPLVTAFSSLKDRNNNIILSN